MGNKPKPHYKGSPCETCTRNQCPYPSRLPSEKWKTGTCKAWRDWFRRTWPELTKRFKTKTPKVNGSDRKAHNPVDKKATKL